MVYIPFANNLKVLESSFKKSIAKTEMNGGLINGATRAVVEGMSGSPAAEKSRDTYVELIAMLLAFFITLVILAFIGQLLWNNVIVDLFSFARPAKSVWQVLGLFIFVSLIRP
jgi:hypothetical protein